MGYIARLRTVKSIRFFSGGSRNDFSILILSPFTIMFFFGMKILELRISTLKGKISFTPSLVNFTTLKGKILVPKIVSVQIPEDS